MLGGKLPLRGLLLSIAGLAVVSGLAAGGFVAYGRLRTPPVPTPEEIFGFPVGADLKLAGYDQIVDYFRRLDAASDRVVLEEIGTSTRGRPMLLALISTAENLRKRERYREISQRLALARGLTPETARDLAREGKSIVWIDGGLHATEVAHGQMTSELAWHLATDDSDETRRIRENSIVLLMPVMNPDGLDIVQKWYMANVGTPFETAPIPELYHPYVGHDNNRDWFMFTQVESRAVARQLYQEWFPQIVYDHHQSSPFPGRIWGPPFENPVNPNLDPLVVSSLNHVGEHLRRRFDFEGKPGYNSGIVYDLWWNGSMRAAPDFHNMLGFLTETALYRYATPHCYTEREIPSDFGPRADFMPSTWPSTGYTNPWMGGCWHLRDAVDYMLTASLATADYGARFKEQLLYDIYHVGARQIARGERAEGGPFAYVIDVTAQHDATAAVELLRTLRLGGVEIRVADEPFTAGGRTYPGGSYVIPPQSFRPYVVDLMEPKSYPDRRLHPGGPPNPPYDATGYELSLQMGVAPARVNEPFPLPPRLADSIAPAPGGVTGEGEYGYLLSVDANGAARAINRLFAAGAKVDRLVAPARIGGSDWAAGTALVRDVPRAAVDSLGGETGVRFQALAEPPGVAAIPTRAPRIGIYRSWVAATAEGWTRWVLEQYGFSYETLTNAHIRSGDLSGFDVIILPDQETHEIVEGHSPDAMPGQFAGGLGPEGVAALRAYVEQGGWLYAFDRSVDFAISHFTLPVRNAVAGLDESEFFIPGSLVRIVLSDASPLTAGMPAEAIVNFTQSQALEVIGPNVEAFATYAPGNPLTSGWALGAEVHLAGRVAGARMPFGRGQVVLMAFSPHFRGQAHNTFKLLFNPLFAAAAGDEPMSMTTR